MYLHRDIKSCLIKNWPKHDSTKKFHFGFKPKINSSHFIFKPKTSFFFKLLFLNQNNSNWFKNKSKLSIRLYSDKFTKKLEFIPPNKIFTTLRRTAIREALASLGIMGPCERAHWNPSNITDCIKPRSLKGVLTPQFPPIMPKSGSVSAHFAS